MNFNNIDLSGIKRFKKALKQIQTNSQPNKENPNLVKFSGIAYKIISEKYVGTRFKVQESVIKDGNATIYAKGYGIAFDEFGTGLYAEGTYKGDLPKQPITFTTRGANNTRVKKTVPKWEYYYDNPYTKKVLGGIYGWWVGDNLGFQTGRVASNRFYDACQEIKDEIKENKK